MNRLALSHGENVAKASARALDLEELYDWTGASDLYKQVLESVAEDDYQKKGNIQAKIGFCFQMATLQAENQDFFNDCAKNATKAYEDASSTFALLAELEDQAESLRCEALAVYCTQYLQQVQDEVKKGLYSTLEIQKNALNLFRNCGTNTGIITQYLDILQTLLDLLDYELAKDERVEIIELGLNIYPWQKALNILRNNILECIDDYKKLHKAEYLFQKAWVLFGEIMMRSLLNKKS